MIRSYPMRPQKYRSYNSKTKLSWANYVITMAQSYRGTSMKGGAKRKSFIAFMHDDIQFPGQGSDHENDRRPLLCRAETPIITQREPETGLTDLYIAVIQTKLTEGYDVVLTVTGHSMRPLWRHRRDTITLTSCNPGQLRVGDIPLYRRENGQPVLHRIIKVDRHSFDLCGDNQIQVEQHLPKSNVIGVVQSFTRNGKTYSCSHWGYQAYSWLWLGLLPWRRWILGALNRLGIMN